MWNSEPAEAFYYFAARSLAWLGAALLFNIFIRQLLLKLEQNSQKKNKPILECFSKAAYKPVRLFAWIFAFVQIAQLATAKFFTDPVFPYQEFFFAAASVACLGWFSLKWKNRILQHPGIRKKMHDKGLDQGKIDLLNKISTVFILFICSLLVIEASDFNLKTLLAFGGVGGLALAFASQEIIANFFGGVMVYLNQPFSVGDWIHLPERNIEGVVEEIGWYRTLIRSLDKKPIYVPNAIFTRMIVYTPSRMTHRQFKETIGLRYQDTERLKAILSDIRAMLEQHPDVDKSQSITSCLAAFGAYSLDVLVSAYLTVLDKHEFNDTKEDILFKIIEIVKKHGADFAYPTTSVEFINSMPAHPQAGLHLLQSAKLNANLGK